MLANNTNQNAGQNGSFYYNAIGNQTSTWLVLVAMLILLVAFLRSEARYRALLERFYTRKDELVI